VHPPSEELFAYRDGELGPEKRAVVEAHVMGCSVCRALIDQVSALEAELRRSPDSAPDGYFDALGESVRARMAGEAPGAVESRPSPRPAVTREPAPVPAPARETARIEREERRESGRVKEVPRLPWAAVIGTASAAAAVLVVVVILIRQGPYQRMVMPERRSVPMSVNPDSGAVNGGELKGQAQNVPPPTAGGAPAEPAPSVVTAPGVPSAEVRAKQSATQNRLDEGMRDQLSKKADEVAMKAPAAAQAPATGAAAQLYSKDAREESDRQAQAKTKAEPRALASLPAASGYQAILDRFGLPALWDATVTPDALSNAEPELRSYYMSGNAGADSARVRLYLAEAARLRYGPGDSELYDEIQHHYQRVIELAGPDAEVARVARERLRSLER